MASVPGHGLGTVQRCCDGVEQTAVPMVLQHAPDTLYGVVFAVIGRVVGQLNGDLELVNELREPVHKLRATAVVFPPVVLIDQDGPDLGESFPLRRSEVTQAVHDEVTGNT